MAGGNVHRHTALDDCYGALAPIYDRVMAHVDYDQWLDLIDRVAAKYQPSASRRLFEIGGGTGVLGAHLVRRGYAYWGSDLSFPMCSEAARQDLRFVCTDGRALPVNGPFDMVVFLYDGINYLLHNKDYCSLFSEVHRILDRDGVFLFDITTEANSRTHFLDFVDFEELTDSYYVRHSYYDLRTRIQHNDFTIFARQDGTDTYKKFAERHRQRVLPVREIIDLIPEDLFSVLGVWDGYSFKRHSHRSDRIHFCLRKRS